MNNPPQAFLRLFGTALLLLSSVVVPLRASAAPQETLRLRVSDAVTEPGGIVSLVVRTYAPRPISQGQICLTIRDEEGAVAPLVTLAAGPGAVQTPMDLLLTADTFSTENDAVSTADLSQDGNAQVVMLDFSSASGSVNELEGSLAAITFRAAADLTPQDSFIVEIDPALSFFVGDDGEPITIDPREGTVSIRPPAAPMQAQVEGDEIMPGETARIEVVTFEPAALGSGRVGVRFNPIIASGPAVVTLDSRHGASIFTVDQSTPGVIIVRFRSPNASFSRVPGEVITIDLPTNPAIPPGMIFPLGLDPSLTFFRDAAGTVVPFALERGTVEFQ